MRSLYTTFGRPHPIVRPHRAHEEAWTDLPVIVEVKAGQQVATAWGHWLILEEHAQHDDRYRDFHVAVELAADPTLVACRLSTFDRIIHEWPLGPYYQPTGTVGRPIVTFARRAIGQAERSRTYGDLRPTIAVAMPEQTADGLVVAALTTITRLRNQGDR